MPVIGEDVHPYLKQLEQALELEVKYRVPVNDNPGGEMSGGITSGMRDGSAHVLRCLKVWYDLPSDVFFNAISSIDRFLAKMKAQPKHLSCIAVAAFHLACLQRRLLLHRVESRRLSEPRSHQRWLYRSAASFHNVSGGNGHLQDNLGA